MAAWMGRAGSDVIAGAELIVPVPLHRWRLWTRRFNQSAALAMAIARPAGKAYRPQVLRRTRRTQQQVGLGPRERAVNVRGAFRVDAGRKAELAGRKVLLVDDVYTTGATAGAATQALLRAGAASVDVLVFARVARGAD
jgi:ComF family protein